MGKKYPKYHSILIVYLLLISRTAFSDTALDITGGIAAALLPATVIMALIEHRDGTGSLQFIEAFGVSTAITYGLKYTVKRKRPNGYDYRSFPSEHAEIAFSSAAFLQQRYGWGYGIPAYIVASYVGFTRIATRWHHPTDVLVGAAIGIGANFIFTRRYHGVAITPYFAGDNTVGVAMQFN